MTCYCPRNWNDCHSHNVTKEARLAWNSVLFSFYRVFKEAKIIYGVGGQENNNPSGREAEKERVMRDCYGALKSSISSSIACVHSLVSHCENSSTYTLRIYVLFCM